MAEPAVAPRLVQRGRDGAGRRALRRATRPGPAEEAREELRRLRSVVRVERVELGRRLVQQPCQVDQQRDPVVGVLPQQRKPGRRARSGCGAGPAQPERAQRQVLGGRRMSAVVAPGPCGRAGHPARPAAVARRTGSPDGRGGRLGGRWGVPVRAHRPAQAARAPAPPAPPGPPVARAEGDGRRVAPPARPPHHNPSGTRNVSFAVVTCTLAGPSCRGSVGVVAPGRPGEWPTGCVLRRTTGSGLQTREPAEENFVRQD